MSDDLEKILSRRNGFYTDEAAGIIKQLMEDNKELTLQLLAAHGQAADALDKLAEAMGSLREIITCWDAPSWKDADQQARATGSVINRARTKLAELEGGEE